MVGQPATMAAAAMAAVPSFLFLCFFDFSLIEIGDG